MAAHKVFIPTAGIGSRLLGLTNNLNKALLSVGLKPNISHIVEKFDNDYEFVIALGYKGDYIRQFLSLAYPDRQFTFVYVDKYDGKGSGLGYSMLQAIEYLQSPFIFISNDTLIADEIPIVEKMAGLGNWIGYSKIKAGSSYRSIKIDEHGKAIGLFEKCLYKDSPSYIGICGIKDYKDFWSIMKDGIDDGSINSGESYALSRMIDGGTNFEAINFEWYDTGNIESLNKALDKYKQKDDPLILQKPDESIWFIDDKIIKFHIDERFINDRIKRAKKLYPYVPKIENSTSNMYTYKKIEGNILSKEMTVKNFGYLLDWLDVFWEKVNLTNEEASDFKNRCLKFYKDKTEERVKLYLSTFNNIDTNKETINGQKVPSISCLLNDINWNNISNGIPVRFHGDLHAENILITKPNANWQIPFALLDWRQNFAGIINYGDIYYDFAKLLHGLIISHEMVNNEDYSFERKMDEVRYDFPRKNLNISCENVLKDYVNNNGYDFDKVKTLTALIFLNIAALHHYPYCNLLFYLGKNMLYNINENISKD